MSRNARVPVPTTTLDQDSTLVVVLELSARSWLVGARVPGIGRLSRYALAPSVEALLDWLGTAKARAGAAGRTVSRVVLADEAGRDGFWLARYLCARGVEVYVIQPSSVLMAKPTCTRTYSAGTSSVLGGAAIAPRGWGFPSSKIQSSSLGPITATKRGATMSVTTTVAIRLNNLVPGNARSPC